LNVVQYIEINVKYYFIAAVQYAATQKSSGENDAKNY